MEETVVRLAFNYYDDLRDKYNSLFKKFKDYNLFLKEQDLERNIISYFDKDGEVVFKSEYEILGVYNKTKKLWTWGWSDPNRHKNEIYISRKILDYGFNIDHSLILLKTELIASRFIISNKIQVEMHVALASYLSKKVVYRYVNKDTVGNDVLIYYIFLLDMNPEEDVDVYLKKDYTTKYS